MIFVCLFVQGIFCSQRAYFFYKFLLCWSFGVTIVVKSGAKAEHRLMRVKIILCCFEERSHFSLPLQPTSCTSHNCEEKHYF